MYYYKPNKQNTYSITYNGKNPPRGVMDDLQFIMSGDTTGVMTDWPKDAPNSCRFVLNGKSKTLCIYCSTSAEADRWISAFRDLLQSNEQTRIWACVCLFICLFVCLCNCVIVCVCVCVCHFACFLLSFCACVNLCFHSFLFIDYFVGLCACVGVASYRTFMLYLYRIEPRLFLFNIFTDVGFV